MRIIFFSLFLLFNFSTQVVSCPSSGDGDCVPSTDSYNQGNNQNFNQSVKETLSVNTSKNDTNEESDGGLPDNYIAKSTNYLKEINKKSKLNAEIKRLNFDINNIIYNSLNKYNSNFSNDINSKLYDVKNIIVQNEDIDKDIFNSIHQNINKLLNSIVDSFNDDKSLKFQPLKINSSNIFDQINKYNEINDIIKTLEVMN